MPSLFEPGDVRILRSDHSRALVTGSHDSCMPKRYLRYQLPGAAGGGGAAGPIGTSALTLAAERGTQDTNDGSSKLLSQQGFV